MSQGLYIGLQTFQSIFLSLCRCYLRFSSKRDFLNFIVMAVRDIDLRTRLSKSYTYLVIFSHSEVKVLGKVLM